MDERSIPDVKSLVSWPDTYHHFMHMDYQVEYDPCTCNHTDGNRLDVSFIKVDTASINMIGRMTTISADLATVDQHGALNLEGDYLTSIMQQGSGAIDGVGTHVFESWDKAADHYNDLQAQVSAHHAQYRAFYTLSSILDKATKEGATFTKGLKGIDSATVDGLIGTTGAGLLKKLSPIASTGLGVLNMVSAGVNVLGAPIKKKGEALQQEVRSLGQVQLSQSEIALTGNIKREQNATYQAAMQIPGRNRNSDINYYHAPTYPTYNEVLGRFAVLDRPNVMWAKRLGEDSCRRNIEEVRSIYLVDLPIYSDTTFSYTPVRQDTFLLRFNGILPYRFNPAANLNEQETELYAALQFKAPKIQDAVNLVSPSVANNTAFKVFEDDTHILYQTRMMPLSCLAEFSAAIVYSFTGHTREWCEPITTEVGIESFGERTEARLKIVANFVFNGLNSFGAAPQALQIYTYKTDFYRERSQDYPILDYPNDIVFDNDIVFQNDTTIFAWNSVEIGASLSTANPNVRVEIIAPNIEMVLNSSVAPEISLFNKDFPVTCTPIQEYPDNLMAAFCSSNSYRANRVMARFVDNDTPPETAQPAKMPKIPARLFPNPART